MVSSLLSLAKTFARYKGSSILSSTHVARHDFSRIGLISRMVYIVENLVSHSFQVRRIKSRMMFLNMSEAEIARFPHLWQILFCKRGVPEASRRVHEQVLLL